MGNCLSKTRENETKLVNRKVDLFNFRNDISVWIAKDLERQPKIKHQVKLLFNK